MGGDGSGKRREKQGQDTAKGEDSGMSAVQGQEESQEKAAKGQRWGKENQ